MRFTRVGTGYCSVVEKQIFLWHTLGASQTANFDGKPSELGAPVKIADGSIPGSAKLPAVAAAAQKERKEKLSIYLMRETPADDAILLKAEDAKPAQNIEIKNATAKLYVRRQPPREPPPWTHLFTEHQALPTDLFGTSSSVGAVLVVRAHQKVFLLSFGTGFHLIRQGMVERDFGLRVTLNSVDPEKLRSLDKASYEDSPLNSRVQSTKEVDIFQLKTDAESDLIYAVTGSSNYPLFGSTVTGRDALTVNVSATVDDIPAILELALDRYASKFPSEFDWMDNVNRVKDHIECELLDLELDRIIAAGDISTLHLGEPEIVDWENQIGYAFDLKPKTLRHPVLQLSDLAAYLTSHGLTMSGQTLRETSVHVINNEQKSSKSWSAYRCFYAEVTYGENQYVLRNGIWYKIEKDYVSTVDSALSKVTIWGTQLPAYNHDREEDYNEHVALNNPAFALMDQKFVQIGGPYDKIEFCDLIHGTGDFVHIKYYRSSATLSHLFSQGIVAIHALLGDEGYRVKLNDQLPATAKMADPAARPDRTGLRIIYGIATIKNLPDELPFFSKVTLRQAMRSLGTLGVDMALARIEVDRELYKRKLVKPKQPRAKRP